jgi:hypothetical protein
MRHIPIRFLELAMRAGAALSVGLAVIWALDKNGLNVLHRLMPDRILHTLVSDGWIRWADPPWADSVHLAPDQSARVHDAHYALNAAMPSVESHTQPSALAEFGLSPGVVFIDPTLIQKLAYVGLHIAGLLVIAWIWWTLAGLVRASRSESPFTAQAAARLAAIGWVILLGGPAFSVANWAILSWMLETSSLAPYAEVASYSIFRVPWWTVGVGAAVLVLAAVWRRGVAMADDLEGLV